MVSADLRVLGIPGLACLQEGLNALDSLCELGVFCPGLHELPMETTQLLALALHLCLKGL